MWSTSGLETSGRKSLTRLVLVAARVVLACKSSSNLSWARAFQWPQIGAPGVIPAPLQIYIYVIRVRVEFFEISCEVEQRKTLEPARLVRVAARGCSRFGSSRGLELTRLVDHTNEVPYLRTQLSRDPKRPFTRKL